MDSYSEELESVEWRQKRLEIIKRDGYECSFCGQKVRKGHPLQVHHLYYVLTNKAWEYPNDALITLCEDCHHDLHAEESVPVYTDNSLKKRMEYTPCKRCDGKGFLKEYLHVQNGICFRCKGMRYEELIEWDKRDELENTSDCTDIECEEPLYDLNSLSFEEYCDKYNLDFKKAYIVYNPHVLVLPIKASKSRKILRFDPTLLYIGIVCETKESALNLDVIEYDDDYDDEFDGELTDIYAVNAYFF